MSSRVDGRESRTGSASRPAGGGRDRDATLQLMIALGRAYRALERGVRPQLAEHDLGLSEFAVLEILYHKGPLTLGEIRDRMLVTGASTTYVVKKLEERGLMRRLAGADDQRTVIGELTEEGRALIAGRVSGPRGAAPPAHVGPVGGGQACGRHLAAQAHHERVRTPVKANGAG